MSNTDESTPKAKLPTIMELSPLDEEFRRDPHPSLKQLRERCPIYRDPDFGHVAVSSEALIREALHDHELGVDPRKSLPDDPVRQFLPDDDRELSILFLDDPDHHRLRKLVAPEFTPRKAEGRRAMVREVARELVAKIVVDTNHEFDLVSTLAGPLPAIAIARILGVRSADQQAFKKWSEDSSASFFTPFPDEALQKAGEEGQANLEALFTREIEARRGQEPKDLIGKMVHAQEDGDRFSEEEIRTMCFLLLVAGNVTTSDLIGNGLRTLLDHPKQLAALGSDPTRIKNAVEEMLRFDPPVTVTGRITFKDIDLGSLDIAAGESMTLLLSAANRDPELHESPDQFNVERDNPEHHSFGGGAHICLGAHLARVEAQEAISALLDRFPKLSPAASEETWKQVPGFRGLSEFRVRVG